MSYLHTKFHENRRSCDDKIMGRTDGQTDGVTALLDLLSPLPTQVIKIILVVLEKRTYLSHTRDLKLLCRAQIAKTAQKIRRPLDLPLQLGRKAENPQRAPLLSARGAALVCLGRPGGLELAKGTIETDYTCRLNDLFTGQSRVHFSDTTCTRRNTSGSSHRERKYTTVNTTDSPGMYSWHDRQFY